MSIIYLQNNFVQFGFDKGSGCIVSVRNRQTKQEHLADPARGRLFRVICPGSSRLGRYADAQDAGPPEITLDEDEGQLTIHYPTLRSKHQQLDIAVTARVKLLQDTAEAVFTLEIANDESDTVQEVWTPWVGGWKGLGAPANDRLLCGCNDHPLHPSGPETYTYNLGLCKRRHFYPYYATMLPFIDASGDGGGLSCINYDRQPRFGGIVVANLDTEPDGESLSFAWVSTPFIGPGETWESAPVGIGVHDSDWHATADRFRRWTDTWWQGPPTPKRVREALGFQVTQLRTFEGEVNYQLKDLPRIAAVGRKFGIDDLCIWDPIAGVYMRPDDGNFWEEFDPATTLDDWRDVLEKAREEGSNVSTLVNYRLVRENSSLFKEIGEEESKRAVSGSLIYDDWSSGTSTHAQFRTDYLTRNGVALCQKVASFQERALALTEQTMELGFTSLFIDQMFDNGPCLAENHGHDSPDDTAGAAIEWGAKAARYVRERNPEAYVLGENADVHALQHIDVSWDWTWATRAPEVMRYTMPDSLFCWVVDHQVRVMNRAFALGFLLALTTGATEETLAEYPAFAERVRELAALRKRCAGFTMFGRFCDQSGLTVDGATAYVYSSPKGLAVVIAETTEKEQSVRLLLDPARLGHTGLDGGKLLWRDGSTGEGGVVGDDGVVRLEIPLPALDVAVWVLEGSA